MTKTLFMRIGIAVEGGLLVLAVVLGHLLDTPPLDAIEASFPDLAWGVAATVPPLIAVFLAVRSGFAPIVRMLEVIDNTLAPILRDATLLELAVLSLLAGLGEEALFRGVVQTASGNVSSPAVGILFASALFGLAHHVTREYAVFAALFGLYLGVLTSLLDNLLVPVVAHALYDFVVLSWLARRTARARWSTQER